MWEWAQWFVKNALKGQGNVKKKKQSKSEGDLVREYADKVINGKRARGHTDKRFEFSKKEGTVNKELWLDTDFFFSVVFQSAEQKYLFLEFLKNLYPGFTVDKDDQIQIVNGMKLGQAMGISLPKEPHVRDYPQANLDLLPLVLDTEGVSG